MKDQKVNYADRLHETQLGQVNQAVKDIQLSKETADILSGRYDNEPLDEKRFPVITSIMKEIAEKNQDQ